MRFIFIVLFLFSFGSVSMGGVGDVYFCDTKKHLVADIEEHGILPNKQFKFKWGADTLTFGKSGLFGRDDGLPFVLKIKTSNPHNEIFWVDSGDTDMANPNPEDGKTIYFIKGDFYFTSMTENEGVVVLTSIIAKCDKF